MKSLIKLVGNLLSLLMTRRPFIFQPLDIYDGWSMDDSRLTSHQLGLIVVKTNQLRYRNKVSNQWEPFENAPHFSYAAKLFGLEDFEKGTERDRYFSHHMKYGMSMSAHERATRKFDKLYSLHCGGAVLTPWVILEPWSRNVRVIDGAHRAAIYAADPSCDEVLCRVIF